MPYPEWEFLSPQKISILRIEISDENSTLVNRSKKTFNYEFL